VLTLIVEGGPPPSGPAGREVCVWRDSDGGVFARAWASGTLRRIDWRDLGTFLFEPPTAIVRAWPAPASSAEAIEDTFARVLQPIILQAMGLQSLHGSAVLGRHGVLAFCGVGFSGKSTLAFALGRAGYRQIADDAVVLERQPDGIHVRRLPFAPGLRAASQRHFDQPHSSTLGEAIGSVVPLRGIFILTQDEDAGEPLPPARIPPVRAFSALLTHARCFDESDPVHIRRMVDDYLAVAEYVPVYSLCYPPRFLQLPALVDLVTRVGCDLGAAPFDVPRTLAAVP
jgi:hypothetical protein